MDYYFKKKEDINKLSNIFDIQIKKEYRKAFGDKYKCPSYWKKIKFIESIDFTLKDWKQIRNEDYWKTRDYLQSIANKSENEEQKILLNIKVDKFILSKIIEYKKTKIR